MATLCEQCDKREECTTPCEAVRWYLHRDNPGVMEKHEIGRIVVYPQRGEVHFTELSNLARDQIDDTDVVPWSSGEHRLKKTTVFVERFFNKIPCKDLADRLGVKENTVVCMFKQAKEQITRIVDAMDSRREGIKAVQTRNFTEDEKAFLLVEVFGFNRAEVARMFKKDHKALCSRLKMITDKYKEAFSNPSP